MMNNNYFEKYIIIHIFYFLYNIIYNISKININLLKLK